MHKIKQRRIHYYTDENVESEELEEISSDEESNKIASTLLYDKGKNHILWIIGNS